MVLQLIYRPEGAPVPVHLPLSKSIALRVLTLNAVSRRLGAGEAEIPAFPDAEDVEGMLRALRRYDLLTDCTDPAATHSVHIGEGGAPLRFFTALAASTPGLDITVATGRSLMRRPLKVLLDALRQAGADIRCQRHADYPPLRIVGRQLSPGEIVMNPGVSSQYISALMMAAPLWGDGLQLSFGGERPVSAPYIAMTAALMRRFGADLQVGESEICVAPGRIKAPAEIEIETDWSAASYFYELALLLPGTDIPLHRLTPAADSLQGDSRCREIFSLLGVDTINHPDGSATLRCNPEKVELFRTMEEPLQLDMNATPDLVPALAVGFCLAGIRFTFSGVAHLRHKETNRMQALANELEKIGYGLQIEEDRMSWLGRRTPAGDNESIATYGDHRMAMAFAPAAVRLPYLVIEDPEVVGKSYPGYWHALEGLGFRLERPGAPLRR